MEASEDIKKFIKGFEGCKLVGYLDDSDSKIPTVGWGHTGPEVHKGMVITQEEADHIFDHDLAGFVKQVNNSLLTVHTPLNQNQFDALVSFAYNCAGWHNSTLLRKVLAGDFAGASVEFPRWVHAGKTILPGLVKRRAAEQKLFCTPV